MRPAARVKFGLKVALRRRYGYAALRVLRRALAAALEQHHWRSIGPAKYVSELQAIDAAYWGGLKRLRKRWPDLDLEDERSRP
jgi:hypothetical protein